MVLQTDIEKHTSDALVDKSCENVAQRNLAQLGFQYQTENGKGVLWGNPEWGQRQQRLVLEHVI